MKKFLLFLIFICYSVFAVGQNSYSKRRALDVYSYAFDGVDSKVSFPDSDSLNLESTDPFTFETWVNIPNITSADQYLYNKFDATLYKGTRIYISNGLIAVSMANTVANRFAGSTSILEGYVLLANNVLPTNQWLHICISYDGSGVYTGFKFYFSGKLYPQTAVNTNNLSGSIITNSPVKIGSQGSLFDTHKQSVTRLFRKVLDSTEISVLYNKGVVNFNHGISRCVFDMQIRRDQFSSNYTVIDSALDNNGVTAGMVADQKLKVDSMYGMAPMAVQTFTGDSIYYNTFRTTGGGGDGTANLMMHSPFTDRFRTPIVYDHTNNQTYVAFVNRAGIGFDKQSRLLKILHDGKIVAPAGKANYSSSGKTDGHLAPAITITPDNEILLAREEQHTGVMYFEKTTGKSQTSLSIVSQMNNLGAYPQPTRIGSNTFLWIRTAFGQDVDDLCKSSDNGVTWNCHSVVTTEGPKAYSMCVYDSTKLRYMITAYNNPKFVDNYYIESTDGVTFYNASHSFSKNIVTSGVITKAELDNNYLAKTNIGDSTDIMLKAVVATASGKIVSITNSDSTHYSVVYWNGSIWQTKSLNIPNWYPPGYTGTRVDFFVLYPYSDTHFVFWRIESRGGYDVIVEYTTTDFFDTIDEGTIVSAANVNHHQLNGTFNINDAGKVVIAANAVYATENKLFLYEFTP